ncbi:MAG: hypothetical protein ABSB15_11530 [Bryobacteraceae bacterium]|jgi:hypothetical protein
MWLVLAVLPVCAQAAGLTLDIPPVRTSWNVSGQPIALTISGAVSEAPAAGRGEIAQSFNFNLRADLRDFQDHLTPLLQSELNQSNRCGERMSVEQADIVPAAPAAHLTVRVHFEKWVCLKAFGKENAKRLVGGDGTVHMVLTPSVEQGGAQGATVRLDAEVGNIEADGSLGELLRSGSVGAALREKIRDAILKAVERSTDLGGVLPAQAQPFVTLRSVTFGDDSAGALTLRIAGGLLVPAQQVSSLLAQFSVRR